MSLEELNLSHNHITTLHSAATGVPFGPGRSLRMVNLENNELPDLTDIESVNWRFYRNLTKLDLSYNRIQGRAGIPIFFSVNPLEVVLERNRIISFSLLITKSSLLDFLSDPHEEEYLVQRNLTKVQAHYNPVQCDCGFTPDISVVLRNATSVDLDLPPDFLSNSFEQNAHKNVQFSVHCTEFKFTKGGEVQELNCTSTAQEANQYFADASDYYERYMG